MTADEQHDLNTRIKECQLLGDDFSFQYPRLTLLFRMFIAKRVEDYRAQIRKSMKEQQS